MTELVKQTPSPRWIGGIVFIFLLAMWAIPSSVAYRVTDLECSVVPGGVMVTVQADGAVHQSAFTIGEPDPRLVVDLSDAVHSLPRYHYEQLGTHLITRIRTSQYLPYPEPVVRIVLDMPQLLSYQIETEANKLMIVLQAGAVPSEQGPEAPPATQVSRDRPALSQDSHDVPATDRIKSQMVPTQGQPPSAEEGIPTESRELVQKVTEPAVTSSQPETLSVVSESVPPVAEGQVGVLDQSEPEKSTLLSRLVALGIREPVAYSSGGRRDPFVALPTGQEVEFGQTPLPDVEKLSIVGILKGPDGYRGLVQDDKNNGYVLRKGDRVLYGYVVRIEAERIVFRLNRRGLDRTIILKLPQ